MDYSDKDKDFFIEKFYGYTGNDTITGGTGSDIAGYRDVYANYEISKDSLNVVTVKHKTFTTSTIDDGTDTLTGIEKIKFSDKVVNVSSIDSSSSSLEIIQDTSYEPFSRYIEIDSLRIFGLDEVSDNFLKKVAATYEAMFTSNSLINPETRSAFKDVLKENYIFQRVGFDSPDYYGGGDKLPQHPVNGSYMDNQTDYIWEGLSRSESSQISEVIEHLLHTITAVAFPLLYEDWKWQNSGSKINLAMQQAIEGGYYDVSSYEDIKLRGDTEGYAKTTVIEFSYWLILAEWEYFEITNTSNNNTEFTLRTPSDIADKLPLAHELYLNTVAKILSPPDKTLIQSLFSKETAYDFSTHDPGADTITGNSSANNIQGGAGNDIIDGGSGIDTAVYQDVASNYSITRNTNNSITIKHSNLTDNSIDDGTDILTSIENIQFTDQTIKSTTINFSDESLYSRSGTYLGNSYTIKMLGNDASEIYSKGTGPAYVVGINVLSKNQITGIMDNYEYVIKSISKSLTWKGTLDFVVVVQGDTGHPTGLLPSIAFQFAEDESGEAGVLLGTNENRVHVPTYEQLSGIDLNGNEPDLGFYINITENNEFKNYDYYVWIDPNPSPTSYSNLPSDQHDLISIIAHEMSHAMGIAGSTDSYWGVNHYSKSLIEIDGRYYYSSERITNLIGKDLLTDQDSLDHHELDAGGKISNIPSLMSGEMYSQRWSEPGEIEYAILYDAGWTERTTGKLSKTIDSTQNVLQAHSDTYLSGTLNFNAGNNIIILDGQATTYRGLEGDDTYFVSQLLPKNSKISITDTSGDNTIQLPANTYIDTSLFTKNAARLTLEDGREVTISGADKFTYNVGGNITNGTPGTEISFTEFADIFGVYDILNTSGAQTGTISDMYII